jgi:hypothetical protein
LGLKVAMVLAQVTSERIDSFFAQLTHRNTAQSLEKLDLAFGHHSRHRTTHGGLSAED